MLLDHGRGVGHHFVATDQLGSLDRQVVRKAVEAPQRRKLLVEFGMHHLPDPLGLGEIAQTMRAQVAELDRFRAALQEMCGEVRDQDLSAVADGHDPRRPVERSPSVVLADLLNFAGVQPHAHPRTVSREATLCVDGRARGRAGGFERGGDAVAHRGEDRAPLDGDRMPKHAEVSFDHLVHLRHPLPTRGGAFHVGEQEREGRTGRGCGVRHSLIPFALEKCRVVLR